MGYKLWETMRSLQAQSNNNTNDVKLKFFPLRVLQDNIAIR